MRKVILQAFFLFIVSSLSAQLIRQPITNFSPRDFGQDVSSYTYSIAECDNGLIYVGTAFGVLQYDGVAWRFIPVKVGAAVTSIGVHKGRVYIGCHGDFGYLTPNDSGKFYFKSLASDLPKEDVNFSAVWKVLVLNDTIVFQAEESLFLYHNQSVTIIKPEKSFHQAFVDAGQLYVRERSQGLMVFDGTRFNLVPGGEKFLDYGVFAILPYTQSGQLLITREIGLWIKEGSNYRKVTLSKELDNQLAEAELLGAIVLDDGNYALYSIKGGLYILNQELNLLASYNINNGLPTSEIRGIAQDHYGNIWLATQKGASRLQYTSPFSIFDQSMGLFGNVKDASKINGNYLVGTNEGLFISQKEGLKAFEEITTIKGNVTAMQSTPTGLWIATKEGLWFYNGKFFNQINRVDLSSIAYIPEKKWVVTAGLGGFLIIDELTKSVLLNIRDIRADSYGLAYEFLDYNQVCQIWMGTVSSGVWQFRIKNDHSYSYDFYNFEDGLPLDWVCAYQVGSQVLFATSKGMLRFISPMEIYGLLNDESVDVEDLRGYFDGVDFPKYSFDKAITAFSYSPKTSYIALDYHVNTVSITDSVPSSFGFRTLELGRLNSLRHIDDELLVGGDDGFAIVRQIGKSDREYLAPNLSVRSITLGIDSVVWYGDSPLNGKPFLVPYSLNNIQIDLASTYYDNGAKALYTWRIKGTDSQLMRWSPQSTVTLSNLREGNYEIVVVAKNIYDQTSNELTIVFRVLPPWFRTWWAYTLYVLLALALVYAIIQFNIRRLKEQNRRLEEIVKARTKEVVEQKEQIEHILQDIQASINYAQRIQQALLPSRELIADSFPKHFIIFHPRDVVSGDFYWSTKVDQWVIVTVADCTGHGVPGAFMSMLGISFLNEIVRKKEVVNAAMILDQLREAVIEALKQTGKQNEQKDGMDMCIAAINTETRQCLWAGANNPLYIVRQGVEKLELNDPENSSYRIHSYESCQLTEIRADKMPVAIYTVMDNYTSHELQLQEGDRIYLFTDGYSDQFGGPDHRKFLAKNFRDLIAKTSSLPIDKQGMEIDRTFKTWMISSSRDGEQIDDVTVMGIEL